MNEIEKSYIAGIIDGEGSIMLEKIHKNNYPSPVISVTSTTIELLEYLKATIGFGKITKKTNYNIEKHKNCYTFVVNYNNAINLLKDVYPYLIIKSKKLRAKMIIEEYKNLTPRNSRYSEELLKEKYEFYRGFREIKKSLSIFLCKL
ncbi:MAG: LAGLIDADG family homing endonuclease [Clostridium septicum]|uniref:LAGLIDADG family homing endonuclease n=1 Tax=Clostridium septicum TaxID=1504 RepID=UPI00258ECD3B|nr:LAGLIDADG family homing endonuclease [Clostridium septicum]MDU1312807.1 LAGLIDADG family homing endonuclease [Clostridium septicum]